MMYTPGTPLMHPALQYQQQRISRPSSVDFSHDPNFMQRSRLHPQPQSQVYDQVQDHDEPAAPSTSSFIAMQPPGRLYHPHQPMDTSQFSTPIHTSSILHQPNFSPATSAYSSQHNRPITPPPLMLPFHSPLLQHLATAPLSPSSTASLASTAAVVVADREYHAALTDRPRDHEEPGSTSSLMNDSLSAPSSPLPTSSRFHDGEAIEDHDQVEARERWQQIERLKEEQEELKEAIAGRGSQTHQQQISQQQQQQQQPQPDRSQQQHSNRGTPRYSPVQQPHSPVTSKPTSPVQSPRLEPTQPPQQQYQPPQQPQQQYQPPSQQQYQHPQPQPHFQPVQQQHHLHPAYSPVASVHHSQPHTPRQAAPTTVSQQHHSPRVSSNFSSVPPSAQPTMTGSLQHTPRGYAPPPPPQVEPYYQPITSTQSSSSPLTPRIITPRIMEGVATIGELPPVASSSSQQPSLLSPPVPYSPSYSIQHSPRPMSSGAMTPRSQSGYDPLPELLQFQSEIDRLKENIAQLKNKHQQEIQEVQQAASMAVTSAATAHEQNRLLQQQQLILQQQLHQQADAQFRQQQDAHHLNQKVMSLQQSDAMPKAAAAPPSTPAFSDEKPYDSSGSITSSPPPVSPYHPQSHHQLSSSTESPQRPQQPQQSFSSPATEQLLSSTLAQQQQLQAQLTQLQHDLQSEREKALQQQLAHAKEMQELHTQQHDQLTKQQEAFFQEQRVQQEKYVSEMARLKDQQQALITNLNETHAATITTLADQHRAELNALREKGLKWHQETDQRLHEDHAKEVAKLKQNHAAELQSVKDQSQRELDTLQQQLLALQESSRAELAILREQLSAQQTSHRQELTAAAEQARADLDALRLKSQSELDAAQAQARLEIDATREKARLDLEAAQEKLRLAVEAAQEKAQKSIEAITAASGPQYAAMTKQHQVEVQTLKEQHATAMAELEEKAKQTAADFQTQIDILQNTIGGWKEKEGKWKTQFAFYEEQYQTLEGKYEIFLKEREEEKKSFALKFRKLLEEHEAEKAKMKEETEVQFKKYEAELNLVTSEAQARNYHMLSQASEREQAFQRELATQHAEHTKILDTQSSEHQQLMADALMQLELQHTDALRQLEEQLIKKQSDQLSYVQAQHKIQEVELDHQWNGRYDSLRRDFIRTRKRLGVELLSLVVNSKVQKMFHTSFQRWLRRHLSLRVTEEYVHGLKEGLDGNPSMRGMNLLRTGGSTKDESARPDSTTLFSTASTNLDSPITTQSGRRDSFSSQHAHSLTSGASSSHPPSHSVSGRGSFSSAAGQGGPLNHQRNTPYSPLSTTAPVGGSSYPPTSPLLPIPSTPQFSRQLGLEKLQSCMRKLRLKSIMLYFNRWKIYGAREKWTHIVRGIEKEKQERERIYLEKAREMKEQAMKEGLDYNAAANTSGMAKTGGSGPVQPTTSSLLSSPQPPRSSSSFTGGRNFAATMAGNSNMPPSPLLNAHTFGGGSVTHGADSTQTPISALNPSAAAARASTRPRLAVGTSNTATPASNVTPTSPIRSFSLERSPPQPPSSSNFASAQSHQPQQQVFHPAPASSASQDKRPARSVSSPPSIVGNRRTPSPAMSTSSSIGQYSNPDLTAAEKRSNLEGGVNEPYHQQQNPSLVQPPQQPPRPKVVAKNTATQMRAYMNHSTPSPAPTAQTNPNAQSTPAPPSQQPISTNAPPSSTLKVKEDNFHASLLAVQELASKFLTDRSGVANPNATTATGANDLSPSVARGAPRANGGLVTNQDMLGNLMSSYQQQTGNTGPISPTSGSPPTPSSVSNPVDIGLELRHLLLLQQHELLIEHQKQLNQSKLALNNQQAAGASADPVHSHPNSRDPTPAPPSTRSLHVRTDSEFISQPFDVFQPRVTTPPQLTQTQQMQQQSQQQPQQSYYQQLHRSPPPPQPHVQTQSQPSQRTNSTATGYSSPKTRSSVKSPTRSSSINPPKQNGTAGMNGGSGFASHKRTASGMAHAHAHAHGVNRPNVPGTGPYLYNPLPDQQLLSPPSNGHSNSHLRHTASSKKKHESPQQPSSINGGSAYGTLSNARVRR